MKRILCGIDPGLSTTGYAILAATNSRNDLLDAGVCRNDAKTSLSDRLLRLYRDVKELLADHRPHLVAVEQLYSHYQHPRTAILMGHARGVILLAAAEQGVEVRSYASTRVKRHLTGNGRASKLQVQRAVQRELGLANLPDPPDLADALAIALCCAGESARDHARENHR
jgi:crossover junction endodeoxyribonuclease RuvC